MLRSKTMYQQKLISDNNSFEIWKTNVDKLVFSKLNMHCNDLPDEDYWDYWYNNLDPQQMAQIVIKNAIDMIKHYDLAKI